MCQWYKRMYLWAKAREIVKNEKLQCRTNQDSDVTYCKRRVTAVFVLGEKQWMKSYARNSDWS